MINAATTRKETAESARRFHVIKITNVTGVFYPQPSANKPNTSVGVVVDKNVCLLFEINSNVLSDCFVECHLIVACNHILTQGTLMDAF